MINLRLYNITINPIGLAGAARNQYIRQVHEHLNWIHLTKSGRILLNCIRRPTFPIEVHIQLLHAMLSVEARIDLVSLGWLVLLPTLPSPFPVLAHAARCQPTKIVGAFGMKYSFTRWYMFLEMQQVSGIKRRDCRLI